MVSTKKIFTMYGVPDVGIVEHNKSLWRFCVEDLDLICLSVKDGHINLMFTTPGAQCLIFLVGEDPHAQWILADEEEFCLEIWNALKTGELSMFTPSECAIEFIYNSDFVPVLT